MLKGNTFQVVLATDGEETYAVFLYANNRIQWSRSGGVLAQAGSSGGGSAQALGSNLVGNLDDNTNAGEVGKYVIRLNDNSVPGNPLSIQQ